MKKCRWKRRWVATLSSQATTKTMRAMKRMTSTRLTTISRLFFFTTPGISRTGRPGSSGRPSWRTATSVSYLGHAWRSSSMCGTWWRRTASSLTRASQSTCFGRCIFWRYIYPGEAVNLQLDGNVDDIICYKKDPVQPNWKNWLPESKVVHTIKWFHQVMRHPGEKKVMWDVEPTSSSSQALVSDWCGKKSPSILTPTTGNIIFRISSLLESCQVKVNGWQVELNALTCADKASELVKLISNNTSCAKNISAW